MPRRTIKKTTTRTKNEETSRNFEEKIHQKKPPSHRVIKKSTRRRNINVLIYYIFLILTTVKSSKEKKIKTVIKQTKRVYSTRYPCYITLRNVLNSQSSLVDVKASFATTGKVYPFNRPKKRSG